MLIRGADAVNFVDVSTRLEKTVSERVRFVPNGQFPVAAVRCFVDK